MRYVVLFAALFLANCTYLGQIAWQAADQAGRYSAKRVVVNDIQTPDGFRAVRIVNGLNFPSAVTFDDAGNIYILESHTVPAPMIKPKIVRVAKDGAISGIPLNAGDTAIGLTFHDGWLWVSHEEKDGTFSISRVRPTGGAIERVLTGLPTQGDHDVNHLIFDPQGNLYFGVGSATNSGVVAAGDPVNDKWLKKYPQARDLPCVDIGVSAQVFDDGKAKTGAYQAHGQSTQRTIPAAPICTSSIYRLKPGSKTPELVAWGFRNPVAFAFDAEGGLLVANQGADVRSTRPVPDDPDSVLRVREGAWYGWPDYSAILNPLPIPPVIERAGSGLIPPNRTMLVGYTEPHAAICGMTRAPDGRILLAEMGDFKPITDPKTSERAGYQVEAMDPRRGHLTPILRNRNEGDAQPASTLDLRNGFERPVDVRIGPDGLIYVLDFGAFVTSGGEPKAFPKTGKLFRIERAE